MDIAKPCGDGIETRRGKIWETSALRVSDVVGGVCPAG